MKSYQAIFLVFFLSIVNYAGGVINNGDFIGYTNYLLGFQTIYPKTWSRREVNNSINFIAPYRVYDDYSFVNLSQETNSDIDTSSDLLTYLTDSFPDIIFSPIELANMQGYRGDSYGEVIFYLLRQPGSVVRIVSYVAHTEESQLNDIVLGSFNFAVPSYY